MTAILLSGLLLSGCSYRLGSMFESNKGDSETTGSIGKAEIVADTLLGANARLMEGDTGLPEADLAYTRQAAADALIKGGKGLSLPWENPQTGARGSVTPLASAYTGEYGATCRDFLASHIQGETQTWLQGEACQSDGGWRVRGMRTWKRS
jgi:surface antigen